MANESGLTTKHVGGIALAGLVLGGGYLVYRAWVAQKRRELVQRPAVNAIAVTVATPVPKKKKK